MKIETYYFMAVNYGTAHLIEKWQLSIKKATPKNYETKFLIIDNYYSEREREKVRLLTKNNNIDLIESENIGYGAALNKGFKKYKTSEKNRNSIIFAGNLDINYIRIPHFTKIENKSYIPKVMEKSRNRNPFLTKAQKKTLFIFRPASKEGNRLLFLTAVAINKIVGMIPSKTWAVHGSLFCINSDALKSHELFNEKSFLYAEELEFASYLEKNLTILEDSNIEIRHVAHAATSTIGTSKSLKKFMKYWKPSFINWQKRWNP